MSKKRFASEEFVNKALSNAGGGGGIPVIAVGETLHLDGDGYYGEQTICVLQRGTYWIDNIEFTVGEMGICILSRQADYYNVTFICESGIKFFDYLDVADSNEIGTDSPNRELSFDTVDSLLTLSAVEDYSTTFSCIHLMSPSGNAYMVSVDDDGQLIATPHD